MAVAISSFCAALRFICAMRLASSIPATITEELLPKPRAKGMSELIRIFKGFMFGANFNATRKSKLVSSVGISEPSSWMISHVSFSFKTSMNKYFDRAIPQESKPGPKFALVAGTRIFIDWQLLHEDADAFLLNHSSY